MVAKHYKAKNNTLKEVRFKSYFEKYTANHHMQQKVQEVYA